MIATLGVEAGRYVRHGLHAGDGDWLETNCATDMWIEVIHSLGLDPVAGLGFTLASDFVGDQWVMFTYPVEDLRLFYGIDVNEMNVWRPLVHHVEEQLSLGCLVSFDVDAFHLPDTRDITYRRDHQKTTICAEAIDVAGRRLGYFHNAGYATLAGEDFDAVFLLGPHHDEVAAAVPPAAFQIRLDRLDHHGVTVAGVADRLAVHLRRAPVANPVTALTKRLLADTSWLVRADMDDFHRYAFGTCRHLGANGQLAAAFVDWLDRHDGGGLTEVGARLREVSAAAKRLEFMLARLVAGRRVDVAGVMAPIEESWAAAVDALGARYGP